MTRSFFLLGCLLLPGLFARVEGTEIAVPADGPGLQQSIAAARPGDVLTLASGRYPGSILIDKPLTLRAANSHEAEIGGQGQSHVIVVAAADVTIEGLRITGSGTALSTEDSGIFVTRAGHRARIVGNLLEGNLIGIYLKGPDDARVRDNRIIGRDDLRLSESGNGIHLWNTPGSIVENNDVSGGRDGIFVTTSRNNLFRNNRFRDLRYAIHYMYTNHSRVEGNHSTRNHMGYALMYSSHLEVRDNVSSQDRDKGILLNYTNDSRISGNQVHGSPQKCVFIYNANFNHIQDNRFRNCDIGVHFTAGSEENVISGNSFDNNRTQVKYVGTRHLDWSHEGRGNHWSDHVAFDRNADGIADNPYQPNSLADQIVWRHASANILLNSPVMHLLRWAQSRFPALHPGGVIDSAPLMRFGADEP